MEQILKLENVTHRFGGLVAVSGANMIVYENEIVGLIGPNGAGKTTAFNIITGIYKPTEGRIIFCGEDVTDKKVHEHTEAGMARTFQNIRLFSKLTVLENVKIGRHVRQKKNLFSSILRTPAARRAEEKLTQECLDLLERTGLAPFADLPAGSLPMGFQRRLEIVRAMATGCRLLLLDEPAAGMNENETQELMDFIKQLQGVGYTIFLIEHDMKLVMNVCERIYVQDHGVLIADGTPEEIRSNQKVIDAYLGEEE